MLVCYESGWDRTTQVGRGRKGDGRGERQGGRREGGREGERERGREVGEVGEGRGREGGERGREERGREGEREGGMEEERENDEDNFRGTHLHFVGQMGLDETLKVRV